MRSKDTVFIVILVLLVMAGLVSWALYFKTPLKEDTVSIHDFPKNIGPWKSEEMVITDDEYAILETRNAFVRKYSTPKGEEIFLFIVYSQNNRKVAHPPEVCYVGGGVSIVGSVHDTISVDSPDVLIKANRLNLEHGRDKQIAYYWFKVGGSFTANYWKQQLLIAFKTLTGQPSGSALIRISATVYNGDEAESVRQIKEFTKFSMPEIVQYLP